MTRVTLIRRDCQECQNGRNERQDAIDTAQPQPGRLCHTFQLSAGYKRGLRKARSDGFRVARANRGELKAVPEAANGADDCGKKQTGLTWSGAEFERNLRARIE